VSVAVYVDGACLLEMLLIPCAKVGANAEGVCGAGLAAPLMWVNTSKTTPCPRRRKSVASDIKGRRSAAVGNYSIQ
jgi:hypothetical protein